VYELVLEDTKNFDLNSSYEKLLSVRHSCYPSLINNIKGITDCNISIFGFELHDFGVTFLTETKYPIKSASILPNIDIMIGNE
jgi:hypothetical protein